jgi:hypothetical protein
MKIKSEHQTEYDKLKMEQIIILLLSSEEPLFRIYEYLQTTS